MFPSGLRTLCLCILLTGYTAAPANQGNTPAAQNQQRARADLDQMITALGGNAYMNLENSESDGRSGRFYQGRSEGSTEFHRYWQWPDKERVELTKQRDLVQLTVSDKMYEITFRGSRLFDPSKDYDAHLYLERRRRALEVILRQWLNEPGIALFDEGRSLVENHDVERITIITPENDAVSISIDGKTHLPVKKTFEIRDPQGHRDEIGEIYDNWKMVQGVNTPYNILFTRNGELQRQYFLSNVSYNVKLDSAVFDPLARLPLGKK